MGRKNVLKSFKMLDAADMSQPQTSSTTSVMNMDIASIHVYWTGATGSSTITVQARNGENDPWYDLDFGSAITTSGASGDHQINLLELPFTDIQLLTTAATAGEITATITAKVLGA